MQKAGRSVPSSTVQAVLFFLFCFFLPTQLGRHFFLPFSYITGVRVDYLAPTLYLTDILSALLIILNIRLLAPYLKNIKVVLLIAALFALNVAFSLSVPLFFYRLVRLFQMTALFIIFARQYHLYKKQIITGLAGAVLLQVPLVISQMTLRHSLQGAWYLLGERMFSVATPGIAKAFLQGKEILRPYGTFSHPNSLAGFFLLIELFFLVNKDITNVTFKYVVIFLSSFLVLVSFSKNAILVYLILNLFYAWKFKGCRLCIAATFLTSLVAGALFLTARTDILSFDKRFTLIIQSLSIITSHPLTGTGLGSYLIAQSAFPIKYPYFFLQPVHNIFLLLTAELGIPAALLLLFGTVRFFRLRHPASFLVIAAAVFLTGLSDHYWLTLQQNMLLAPILLGSMMYNKKHGR